MCRVMRYTRSEPVPLLELPPLPPTAAAPTEPALEELALWRGTTSMAATVAFGLEVGAVAMLLPDEELESWVLAVPPPPLVLLPPLVPAAPPLVPLAPWSCVPQPPPEPPWPVVPLLPLLPEVPELPLLPEPD